MFINEYLLGNRYAHICLFIVVLSCYHGCDEQSQQRLSGPQSLTFFLYGPLRKSVLIP